MNQRSNLAEIEGIRVRTTAIVLLALLASPSFACVSPATAVLEDMMALATWTREIRNGTTQRQDATVRMALPVLDAGGFSCLTWNVELVLPRGISMAEDDDGDEASSQTGLAAGAPATFNVRLNKPVFSLAYYDESGRLATDAVDTRIEQGWLRVRVRNPLDDEGVYLANADGSRQWQYSVAFHLVEVVGELRL